MIPSNLTVKSQEALRIAQDVAVEYRHTTLEPIHVLFGLLNQEEGVVPTLVKKIGINVTGLLEDIRANFERMPHQMGGSHAQMAISSELAKALQRAEAKAKTFKDEYISTEHLLLALIESPSLGKELQRIGLTEEAILQALKDVRGNTRIDRKSVV